MTATTQPTVYEAFAAVMGAVQGIRKGERAESGPARFNFRGIDAVMNHVGPALREHGVVIVPTAEHIEVERYPTKSGGQMKNATVRMRYTVFGPAGDSFAGVAFGEAADAGDKAVSKAQSVAYRTFLLQALTVPTDEPDPDLSVHERAARQDAPQSAPPDPLQMAKDRLGAACRTAGVAPQTVIDWAITPSGPNGGVALNVCTDPKVFDALAKRVRDGGFAEPTPDEAKAAVQGELGGTEVPA
ncbi:ERF family protein [Tsukamurella paurometabola]|uniref:ERF superfamily n=1 Tax=Tsukamurella paurometabola TaxID=2061 RepID=A0A3P8MBR9_TSUPA|nr:ERF family protein [Tsukamurella paurometabola]UEA84438.1 ERF family protein [Tsukamurella paurometabola]VDR37003.1 ERF superfamily [Tsukamurella paurometabola]